MGHSSKKSQDSRDAKKDYKRDDKKDCRADYTGSSSEKLSKHSLDKGYKYFLTPIFEMDRRLTQNSKSRRARTTVSITTRRQSAKTIRGPPMALMATTRGVRECDHCFTEASV